MSSQNFKKWIALPGAAEQTDGQVTVGYTGLPVGLDPDKLQVNAAALVRGAIEFGGFSTVEFSAYNGDEDKHSVGIGTDSGGNAYGTGLVSTSKAESSRLNQMSNRTLNAMDIRNGSLGVQWNISALNSRIKTHQQYDPEVRSRQISREVRRGVVKSILSHNISDVITDKSNVLVVGGLGIDGWLMSSVAQAALKEEYLSAGIQVGGRLLILGGLIRFIRSTIPNHPDFKDQIVDPLFWTARPTRALVGAGIVATSKLMRPTPLTNDVE